MEPVRAWFREEGLEPGCKGSKTNGMGPGCAKLWGGGDEAKWARSGAGTGRAKQAMPEAEKDEPGRLKDLRGMVSSRCRRSKAKRAGPRHARDRGDGVGPGCAWSEANSIEPQRPMPNDEEQKPGRATFLKGVMDSELAGLLASKEDPRAMKSTKGMTSPRRTMLLTDENGSRCPASRAGGVGPMREMPQVEKVKPGWADDLGNEVLPRCAVSRRGIGEPNRPRPKADEEKPTCK